VRRTVPSKGSQGKRLNANNPDVSGYVLKETQHHVSQSSAKDRMTAEQLSQIFSRATFRNLQ
jgi:hypothetical protein